MSHNVLNRKTLRSSRGLNRKFKSLRYLGVVGYPTIIIKLRDITFFSCVVKMKIHGRRECTFTDLVSMLIKFGGFIHVISIDRSRGVILSLWHKVEFVIPNEKSTGYTIRVLIQMKEVIICRDAIQPHRETMADFILEHNIFVIEFASGILSLWLSSIRLSVSVTFITYEKLVPFRNAVV